MRLKKLDFRLRKYSFVFAALFSSFLLALTLLINDLIENVINENVVGDHMKNLYKFLTHVFVLFFVTLILLLLFYKCFEYDTVTQITLP
jgi:hypothetical protein